MIYLLRKYKNEVNDLIKTRFILIVTCIVAVIMINVGLSMQREYANQNNIKINDLNFKIQNMSASTNMIVKESESEEFQTEKKILLTEVEMETAPASVITPPRVEVYEGMTLEELADKLNRNLGDDIIAGKGMLIASECINKGVDPYVATSIILHETGCKSKCSNLARYCYNFGGQKGKPSCNGGSFKKYDTIDEGLVGMINNLYKNYYAMGLNTVETIAPKYCEGNTWAGKINWFVNSIRNS